LSHAVTDANDPPQEFRDVEETPLTWPTRAWLSTHRGRRLALRELLHQRTDTRGTTMSKTPTSMFASALSRPHADSVANPANGNPTTWACIDLASTKHHTTVGFTGSKRLTPGSFAGVLT
jgi:hypothetical protein